MQDKRHMLGRAGEEVAARYLEKEGYEVVATNVTCRYGEIDIIARKGDVLACVEVKTRARSSVPHGLLVPASKQRKIVKTAQFFIQKHGLHDVAVRFDVLFVLATGTTYDVTYIACAFYAH